MTKQIIVAYIDGILFSYIEYANFMVLFVDEHGKNCFLCYAEGAGSEVMFYLSCYYQDYYY